MKAKALQPLDTENGLVAVGECIEHPDAWRLVLMGVAEAADGACRETVALKSQPSSRQAEKAKFMAAVAVHEHGAIVEDDDTDLEEEAEDSDASSAIEKH